MSCLRNAVKIEQRQGTVKYHSGVRVDGIQNVDGDLGSLMLRSTANDSSFGDVHAVPPDHRRRRPLQDLDDDYDDDGTNNGSHYSKSRAFTSKKQDEEVLFATTSDPVFVDAYNSVVDHAPGDAEKQKQLLLESFGSWHRPVKTLIDTTPAREIMYELAVAHRHNAGPVFDVGRIMEFEAWQERTRRAKEGGGGNGNGVEKRIDGRGPALVFIGNAMMTVDPVLAQGLTTAMESGASIVESVERILVPPNGDAATDDAPIYRPKLLRDELTQRHHHCKRRLLQLLRSTELVQRLAQPGVRFHDSVFVGHLMTDGPVRREKEEGGSSCE